MSESASAGRIKLTYQDYLALPDDGKRRQLIGGQLIVSPAPSTRHQIILKRLLRRLMEGLEDSAQGQVLCAPVDVLLDDRNVVQPDLLFLRTENRARIEPKFIRGAPDLVIEILSQSTRRTDLNAKSALYARFGVPHYWIVDPSASRIEVFRLKRDRYVRVESLRSPGVLQPDAFPGLTLESEKIFDPKTA